MAAALVSALSERPLPGGAVLFGEVSLSGEIRPVAHGALRLREAKKLGFDEAMVPSSLKEKGDGLKLTSFATLGKLVEHMLGGAD